MTMIKLDSIDRQQALRYLSYKSGEISAAARELLDSCEKEILAAVSPAYSYRYFDLAMDAPDTVDLGGMLNLRSNALYEHLKGCSVAAVMCVTLGAAADTLIRRAQITDMAKAVIFDAYGSSAVEQCADIVQEMISGENPSHSLTLRYSPGYDDLSLDYQQGLLDITNAGKRTGMTVTAGGLLAPMKSITAIIGISDAEIAPKHRDCSVCRAKESCAMRQRGIHCG